MMSDDEKKFVAFWVSAFAVTAGVWAFALHWLWVHIV